MVLGKFNGRNAYSISYLRNADTKPRKLLTRLRGKRLSPECKKRTFKHYIMKIQPTESINQSINQWIDLSIRTFISINQSIIARYFELDEPVKENTNEKIFKLTVKVFSHWPKRVSRSSANAKMLTQWNKKQPEEEVGRRQTLTMCREESRQSFASTTSGRLCVSAMICVGSWSANWAISAPSLVALSLACKKITRKNSVPLRRGRKNTRQNRIINWTPIINQSNHTQVSSPQTLKMFKKESPSGKCFMTWPRRGKWLLKKQTCSLYAESLRLIDWFEHMKFFACAKWPWEMIENLDFPWRAMIGMTRNDAFSLPYRNRWRQRKNAVQ